MGNSPIGFPKPGRPHPKPAPYEGDKEKPKK